MQIAIRLILSSVLIYFVWRETGWATATAISLIALSNEASAYAIRNIIKLVKFLAGR